jgi:hypothetical protein
MAAAEWVSSKHGMRCPMARVCYLEASKLKDKLREPHRRLPCNPVRASSLQHQSRAAAYGLKTNRRYMSEPAGTNEENQQCNGETF